MSDILFQDAQRYIPGGVNSPVRAFKGVGGDPIFVKRAEGAYLHSADGRRYIDYVGSWGPMLAGHAHPKIVDAVRRAAGDGLSFGAPTEIETRLAERICRFMPSIQLVRMVSSGTEATMSAIRLARGFTGRDRIVKFEGCYHGHSDSLLVKAGSGALTLGVPTSPGVPAALAALTLTLPYNDAAEVEAAFLKYPDEIACVIVEPVAGNMNCVLPAPGFLKALSELCTRHGALLIFDEVMTGFRVAKGGAQALYGITPDLTTLGKVIGGGMPVGAFGGRREVMQKLAPLGPVYQAGTLSGNPVAMAAGLAMLGCRRRLSRISLRSSKPRPGRWWRVWRKQPGKPVCLSWGTSCAACSGSTSPVSPRSATMPRSWPRTWMPSGTSSTACCGRASTYRPVGIRGGAFMSIRPQQRSGHRGHPQGRPSG